MKTKILLTALTFLISLQFTNAQKIIRGGSIEGYWTSANSPYIIRGSVYIDEFQTLQIEAGVSVIFETTEPMIVNGSLIAVGNSYDSIIFSTNDHEKGWGGIRFESIHTGYEMSHLSFCKFEYANAHGEWPYNSGGAIGVKYTSNLTIGNCLFENNRALEQRKDGPVNGASGGAIAIWLSDVRLSKNVFRNNESINGGAIFIDKYSTAVIDNSLFYGNTAINSGGAVSVSDHATPYFINCTFADNYANYQGGAVSISDGGSPTFVNSILWGNSALEEGQQINVNKHSGINLYYSNIEGGLGNIAGNFRQDNSNIIYEYDPQYLNTGVFPYSLSELSPCVDMGTLNNLFLPQEYQHPATDLHDNRRIIGQSIDIGYFENELYPIDPMLANNIPSLPTYSYSSWNTVTHTGTQIDFGAIHFTDDDHGWVVGTNGIMIYTTDGGSNWDEYLFGPSTNLKDVYFIDNNTGFVIGNKDVGPSRRGFVYKTTDAGQTWELAFLSESSMVLNSIAFSDSQNGFISGYTLSSTGSHGLITKTTNAGDSWDRISVSTILTQIDNIIFTTEDTFRESNTGWATGRINVGPTEVAVILKSDDGNTWNTAYFANSELTLSDISFYNSSNGFVVGDHGSVISTDNAGHSWVAQNMRQYSFNATLSENSHYTLVVGDNGVVLSSIDHGQHWIYENTPSTSDFNEICSTPNRTIWAVGDNGTLIMKTVGLPDDVGINPDMDKGPITTNDNTSDYNTMSDSPLVSNKNYPNPFAGKTTISFELNQQTHVKLDIYNINGKLISTLKDQFADAGFHEVEFDANELSPGIYTYILNTGNHFKNGKMILNR